jgi:two-component system, response regulator YesN
MKKRRIFYYYLISYLLVLAIPILLYTAFALRDMRARVREHELQTINMQVDQLKIEITTELTELQLIADQINRNPAFSRAEVFSGPLSVMSAVDELAKFTIGRPNIQYALLYYRRQNTAFFDIGTISWNTFFRQEYPGLLIDRTLFEQLLHTQKTIFHSTMLENFGERRRTIICFFPIPTGFSSPYATLVFFIDGKTVIDYLRRFDAIDERITVLIQDEDGNIVASADDDPELPTVSVHETNNTHTWEKIRVAGETRYLHRSAINRYGWNIAVLVPEKMLTSAVGSSLLGYLPLTILVLIGGGILIRLSMRINYGPISRLIDSIEREIEHPISKDHPLREAQETWKRIIRRDKDLQHMWQVNLPALRDDYIRRILMGDFESLQEINDKGREFGIDLSWPHLCVVFVDISWQAGEAPEREYNKRDIIIMIESAVPSGLRCYGKDRADKYLIPYVCSSDTDDQEKIEHRIAQTLQRVESQTGLLFGAGISSISEDPVEMDGCRREAMVTDQYRIVKGDQKVLSHRHLRKFEQLDQLNGLDSLEDLEELLKEIRSGDPANIREWVDDYIQRIRQSHLSLVFARSMMYVLFNVVYRSLIPFSGYSGTSIRSLLSQEDSILGFTTLEQFRSIILSMCDELVTNVRFAEKDTPGIQEIENFIRENYNHYDFSVMHLAENFGYSRSYISKYYKEHTGRTLRRFIQSIRLEKAKEYLTQTNLTVEEVSGKVGYGDVSHFIRIFREHEGLTPGSYRRSCKPAHPSAES